MYKKYWIAKSISISIFLSVPFPISEISGWSFTTARSLVFVLYTIAPIYRCCSAPPLPPANDDPTTNGSRAHQLRALRSCSKRRGYLRTDCPNFAFVVGRRADLVSHSHSHARSPPPPSAWDWIFEILRKFSWINCNVICAENVSNFNKIIKFAILQ